MFKCRLLSALVLIPTVVAIVFLLPPIGLAVTVLIICILAGWEWAKLNFFSTYIKQIFLATSFVLLLIILNASLNYYNEDYHHPIMVIIFLWSASGWWIASLLLVLFYPKSAAIWCRSKLLNFITGLLVIVPFFSSVLTMRVWHCNDNCCCYNGALMLLYVTTLVWANDSGAYILGKLVGRHKLISKVSPNKTWQGCIGGALSATIVSYCICYYLSRLEIVLSSISLFICSICAIVAAILGDLTESIYKREAGVKDSGYLIPGHGGVLDLIDSLTAAFPVFTCLIITMGI